MDGQLSSLFFPYVSLTRVMSYTRVSSCQNVSATRGFIDGGAHAMDDLEKVILFSFSAHIQILGIIFNKHAQMSG